MTVTGVDDASTTATSRYTIVTAAATSTDANYNGDQPGDVVVTNTDDDAAGITVTPTSGLTTTEAGGTATFTVVLDGAADGGCQHRSEQQRHDRRHGQPGVADVHQRQLEHGADGDGHRR